MRYGLIGEKLGHSLSVPIHEALYRHASIDATYDLCAIPRAEFSQVAKRLAWYDGMNVTVPYKKEIMPYLDEIAPSAQAVGAVNTVVKRNGKTIGYNTDVEGFGEMLRRGGVDVQGKSCTVIGSGGASLAVVYYLLSQGAKVCVVSRTPAPYPLTGAVCVGYDEIPLQGDLLVNTTPVGMYPDVDSCVVTERQIVGYDTVADIVYNPMCTRLLRIASGLGKRVLNGLYMLVAQAVAAERLWQDRSWDDSLTRAIFGHVKAGFADTHGGNLYLIGMSGCGKTTLGKALAERTGKAYVDTDDLVVQRSGKSIAQLFAQGEAVFREQERLAILQASQLQNAIVATGGGAILSDANLGAMQTTGIVCLIDRPIQAIAQSCDRQSRPLLQKDADALYRIYESRAARYAFAADVTVNNAESPQQALDELIAIMGVSL